MSNIKSFKEFIFKNEKGVIPAPIHYKHHYKENKKHIQESIKENTWIKKTKNANAHLGKTSEEISQNLIKQRKEEFNSDEENAIGDFTADSGELNENLLNKKKLRPKIQKVKSGLESAIKKNPIKKSMSLYSGVSFDPRKVIKNGRLHSPAFISMTHDPNVAHHFASPIATDNSPALHIIHLHAKPGDPAVHVNDLSANGDGEHETILKSGITLRHLRSEFHKNKYPHFDVHVHHFEIER